MMRVLVCGGRDYTNRDAVFATLDVLKKQYGQLTIIQGGEPGADSLASEWAFAQPSCHLINEPADWKKHGKSAGPIRNQLMLDLHKPELVVAFPGGHGTTDMVRRAQKAKVPVILVGPQGLGDMAPPLATKDKG